MKKHICKQCQKTYDYCRGCLISPILYKELGFCSEKCYEASKNNVVEIKPIVEEVSTESAKEEVFAEVEIEETGLVETPIIETTTVVETAIKKETNTYKKKKNKYK